MSKRDRQEKGGARKAQLAVKKETEKIIQRLQKENKKRPFQTA